MKRMCLYMTLGLLTACSEQLEECVDSRICLDASVGEMVVDGRAVAVPFSSEALSKDHSLVADVWLSNVSGNYDASTPSKDTHVPCHIVMTHEGKPQFATSNGQELKYVTPSEEDPGTPLPVYCVGLYPQGEWIPVDNSYTSVQATIDGSTDLMFAPQISGYWGNPLPVQQFNHQLTWIKVNVCATSQAAKDAWGMLTAVNVKSYPMITVNLGTGNVDCSGEKKDIQAFTGSKSLFTYLQEVGSVFCSPLEYEKDGVNKDKYYVDISVTVDLDGAENTGEEEYTISKRIYVTDKNGTPYSYKENSEWTPQGKLFSLVLYFNEFSMIEGVCTLNAWEAQNEDLYMNPVQNQ